MSVNKAQEQPLKYVDFHSPVFTHGQFYVAVSRATSVNRIKAIWDSKFPNPVTKNHVFPEVLLDYFILCLQGSTQYLRLILILSERIFLPMLHVSQRFSLIKNKKFFPTHIILYKHSL
jgi:hypothetical protein